MRCCSAVHVQVESFPPGIVAAASSPSLAASAPHGWERRAHRWVNLSLNLQMGFCVRQKGLNKHPSSPERAGKVSFFPTLHQGGKFAALISRKKAFYLSNISKCIK